MGVFKFWSWVYNEFKEQAFISKRNYYTEKCDNLLIDFNAMIHSSLFSDLNANYSEDEVIRRVCSNLAKIIKSFSPSKMVFIAIDGVPPRTKINQQRNRRHLNRTEPTLFFDRNKISPGTSFMLHLSASLRKYIVNDILSKSNNDKLQILFSDSLAPGEGEQKIISFLRKNRSVRSRRTVIFSPDSDLILMSLLLNEYNEIIVARERQKSSDSFYTNGLRLQLLSVSKLKTSLEFYLQSKLPYKHHKADRLVQDFVFITAFMGNDFVPCLHSYDPVENSVMLFCEVYTEMLRDNFTYMIDSEGRISLKALAVFLTNFVASNPELIDAADYNENMLFLRSSQRGYAAQSEEVHSLYITSLQWSWNYYNNKPCSWSFYYPYYFSPHLDSLINYLEASNCSDFIEKRLSVMGSPLSPFTHILSVIPHKSSNILPEDFRRLVFDEESEIKEYYPEKYPVVNRCVGESTFDALAVAILKFVDTDLIASKMESVIKLTKHSELNNRFELNSEVYITRKRFKMIKSIFVPGIFGLEEDSKSAVMCGKFDFKKPLYLNTLKSVTTSMNKRGRRNKGSLQRLAKKFGN